MTSEAKDSALSFVGQINKAYEAAEKAGASALSAALECGYYLNLAFENVEAAKGKGKWNQWRKANLDKVSEETERLYRRLAEAVAKKEDFFAKCKSIRDAMKHLAKYEYDDDGNLKLKPERKRTSKPRIGNTVTALTPPEPATPATGLEAELENAAADEIISNIQDDPDKLEEVAQRSIAKLSADKICGALTKALSGEQLRDLIGRLNAFVGTIDATPAETSTFKRRPVTTFSMPGLGQN